MRLSNHRQYLKGELGKLDKDKVEILYNLGIFGSTNALLNFDICQAE